MDFIKKIVISAKVGQSLVELVLVMGLMAVFVPALFVGYFSSRDNRPEQQQRLQAITLLQETEEELKNIKERNWSDISVNGIYHPTISGSEFILATGSATTNGFTDQVVIGDVYRDASGAITSTGGVIDPSTKIITITVSWSSPSQASIQSVIYLTRYVNLSYTQTSVSDFTGIPGNTSNLQGTAITNTSGGEVTLSNQAYADWCKPQNFIVNQINLPKLSNAIYAIQGGAYLGSGDGTPNTPAFINVAINTPAPPATPSASIAGTFTSTITTNSIYSDGRYVYLATTGNPQIVILDLTQNPYSEVGSVTISGGQPANSVYVSGNLLFATSGNKLYSFDVTTKTGSHTTAKSSIGMVAGIWAQPTARQVVVVNGKAYVGTGGSLLGMQSFTFNTDGTNLKYFAAALLTFSQQSQGLYVDSAGHYAYIAFNNASGISFTRGFAVIDLTKTSWFLITFYPTNYTFNTQGMDPRGITIPASNRAIVVGVNGTNQYQVVDTSSLSNMSLCGSLVIPSGIYGVSSILDQYSNAYSYFITGESGNQFKIVRGGLGGNGYLNSGTFESNSFTASSSAAFNNFTATVGQPALTALSMQVGVTSPVNGNCANGTYTYVGPNASTSAFFTPVVASISGAINFGLVNPTYQNPDSCFKYKVFFSTSDTTKTPTLYDMTANYSP